MKLRLFLTAIAGIALCSLPLVAGCGGSDSATVTPVTANITRVTESTFSKSARILAARDAEASGATWLSADFARQADADLAVVRGTFPYVAEITAFPQHDLRSVLVAVRGDAPWLNNWTAGNPTTGEAMLDALLTEFAPETITSLGTFDGASAAYFTVRFGQSLNMVKLAERLRNVSANIVAADPNGTVGDGDNIKRLAGSPNRRYEWSRGSGDCPAGCINRDTWYFDVSADGRTVTLVSEGSVSPGIVDLLSDGKPSHLR